jgi:RNase H-fold protein (predicted Holliday junction resolvase)
MRIMGLDLGDATIGVAVSDELGMIAHGVTTISKKP